MDKEDAVYIYTHTHNAILINHKKGDNAVCSSIDGLEIIILSEVRKRSTDTIWYHLHVESKIWHRWT